MRFSPSFQCMCVRTWLCLCGSHYWSMNFAKETKKINNTSFPSSIYQPEKLYDNNIVFGAFVRSLVSIFISALVGIDNCHFEITIILFEADMRVSGPFFEIAIERKQWQSKFIFILNLFFKWFINLLFQFFLFFHLFSFSCVLSAFNSPSLYCERVCVCVWVCFSWNSLSHLAYSHPRCAVVSVGTSTHFPLPIHYLATALCAPVSFSRCPSHTSSVFIFILCNFFDFV